MVQGKEQRDNVIAAPGPGFQQCGDLGADSLVCAHHALGLVGGTAGEQHHGAAFQPYVWQGAGIVCQYIIHGQQLDIQLFTQLTQGVQIIVAGNQACDTGAAQVVIELSNR